MKRSVPYLLAFCWAVCPLHAAEPAEEDPFDLLEKEKKEENRKKGLLREVRDNAEFKLIVNAMRYYRKADDRPGVDDTPLAADGRLEVRTGLVRGRHQLGLLGWAEYGSQKDTYSQKSYRLGLVRARPRIERARRYVELDELFWVSNWGPLDVTLGKRRLKLGTAPLYSLLDRASPADFNDPLNSKPYGLWLLTVDGYRRGVRYSVTLLPFFTPSKTPGARSRWLPPLEGSLMPKDFQFFNKGIDPASGISEAFPRGSRKVRLLSSAKTTLQGWDLLLTVSTGVAPAPVLRAGDPARGETLLVREYIRATTAGLGFSTTFGKFEVHGEGLFQRSRHDRDDDFFAGLGGLTCTLDDPVHGLGLERILVTVDYAREAVADRQSRTGYLQSSSLVRFGQNDLFALASIQVSPDLFLEALATLNLDDRGRVVLPGFRWRPAKGLWLKVRSDLFLGPSNSFYGRWSKNNRLLVSFEYSF
jgi:hypothetical protein